MLFIHFNFHSRIGYNDMLSPVAVDSLCGSLDSPYQSAYEITSWMRRIEESISRKISRSASRKVKENGTYKDDCILCARIDTFLKGKCQITFHRARRLSVHDGFHCQKNVPSIMSFVALISWQRLRWRQSGEACKKILIVTK